jgi:hypothetical protein
VTGRVSKSLAWVKRMIRAADIDSSTEALTGQRLAAAWRSRQTLTSWQAQLDAARSSCRRATVTRHGAAEHGRGRATLGAATAGERPVQHIDVGVGPCVA